METVSCRSRSLRFTQPEPCGDSRAVGRHLPAPRPRPQRSLPARPAGRCARGIRSLTAPFHLDKDFQGHARSPAAGSSPAPMKSQARCPGPRCCSRTPAEPVAFLRAGSPAQPCSALPAPPCSGPSNASVPVLQGRESSAASLATSASNTPPLNTANKAGFQPGPMPHPPCRAPLRRLAAPSAEPAFKGTHCLGTALGTAPVPKAASKPAQQQQTRGKELLAAQGQAEVVAPGLGSLSLGTGHAAPLLCPAVIAAWIQAA